ncbi:class I SAM-dependent methyltransferase, partial [Halorhodospira abdelmalekii]|uniref:class I SAM-dependent methyltransferase n=1 Tax=Halorhodospira abdelmalekii TaxID=421629 RepID=UPI001903A5E8
MSDPASITWYHDRAAQIAEQYEQLDFAQVHNWLCERLPASGALVLDVGAGSGRDAAWLADQGQDVVAVEPAAALREEAKRRHPQPSIRWLDDALPELAAVHRLGT